MRLGFVVYTIVLVGLLHHLQGSKNLLHADH